MQQPPHADAITLAAPHTLGGAAPGATEGDGTEPRDAAARTRQKRKMHRGDRIMHAE